MNENSHVNTPKRSRIILIIIFALIFALIVLVGISRRGQSSDKTIEDYSDYYLPVAEGEPIDGAIKVTFYGTTMLLFDDGETQILIDAFLTRPGLGPLANSFVTGSATIETDKAVIDEWLVRPEVGQPEAVFVGHSHHDHAMDIAYIAQQTGAQVYGSESTLNIARGGDVPEEQLSLYPLGEELTFGEFTVTVLPGRHGKNAPPVPDDRGEIILEPLPQPAKFVDYVEGGSFDFLITHGEQTIMIKGHTYIPEVINDVRADVMFLTASFIGSVDLQSPDVFYNESVAKVQPSLVIPLHWDSFITPLSSDLTFMSAAMADGFDFMIERLEADGIEFGVMQGYQSIMLEP